MEKYLGIGFIILCLSVLVGIIGILGYHLYIDKEKKVPTKLIVEDNNQNTTINIQYNSIEIN